MSCGQLLWLLVETEGKAARWVAHGERADAVEREIEMERES